jgi:hypothetical protein
MRPLLFSRDDKIFEILGSHPRSTNLGILRIAIVSQYEVFHGDIFLGATFLFLRDGIPGSRGSRIPEL